MPGITAGQFLCCFLQFSFVIFQWRHNVQVSLYALGRVVGHIFFNRLQKFFFRLELMAVVHLSFHDPPETFHGAVIYTMSNSSHALRHSCIQDFLPEFFWCVLVPSVAMENGSCSRSVLHSLVKRRKYKWIIIMISIYICNRSPVTKIQYNAQINLSLPFVFTSTKFELADICNPFLIEFVGMEFPIQYVFCYIGRIWRWFCTTVILMPDTGLYFFLPAYKTLSVNKPCPYYNMQLLYFLYCCICCRIRTECRIVFFLFL